MTPVHLGIMLPTVGRVATGESVAAVARHAERAGATTLWVSDHFTMPVAQRTKLPHGQATYPVPVDRDYLEAFTTLAWAAAQTQRAELGTAVCVAPYRSPIMLAKAVGTLSLLTGRQLNLGVGSGWLKEEFAALDVDFGARHRLTDEAIDFVRACPASDGVVAVAGHAGSEPVDMYIRPYPPETMRVWIGGSGPKARRRASVRGDVWFPDLHGCSPAQARAGMAEIAGLAAQAGRPADAVRLAVFMEIHIGETMRPEPWLHGQQVYGSAGFVLDVVNQYRASGMAELVLAFGGGATHRQDSLDRLLSAGLADALATERYQRA